MTVTDSFFTQVRIPSFDAKIGYQRPFMMLGSCFASNMGDRMVRLKFPVLVNPFGTLYNPCSVANSVQMLVDGKQLSEDDLFFQNGLWNSYTHHSSFSNTSKDECLASINQSLSSGSIMVQESSHIFITLGTSWVYELNKTGEVVANCHKTLSSEFKRRFCSVGEMVDVLSRMIESVRKVNSLAQFIFTVSPIRHIKDGLVENQRSKSALIYAVHEFCSRFHGVSYFPSYEIMMDELRDYRFYAADMVHPSALAIDIIFQKFVESVINIDSQKAMVEVEKVMRAVEHRPFNPNTPEHLVFCRKMADFSEKLQSKYSFLDLSNEIEYFLR